MTDYKHMMLVSTPDGLRIECNEEENTFDVIQSLDRIKEYRNWVSRHKYFEVADKENHYKIIGKATNIPYLKILKANVNDFCEIRPVKLVAFGLFGLHEYKAFFKSPDTITDSQWEQLISGDYKPSEEKESQDWDYILRDCDLSNTVSDINLMRVIINLTQNYHPPIKKTKI